MELRDGKNPLSDGDWVGFWVLLVKNPFMDGF